MYSGAWQTYRRKFLKHNPKCYACGNWSQAVDHITSHLGDKTLFWKVDNYIPLCHSCHNTVTSKFDRFRKKGDSIEPKLKWIAEKRVERHNFVSVKIVPLPEIKS